MLLQKHPPTEPWTVAPKFKSGRFICQPIVLTFSLQWWEWTLLHCKWRLCMAKSCTLSIILVDQAGQVAMPLVFNFRCTQEASSCPPITMADFWIPHCLQYLEVSPGVLSTHRPRKLTRLIPLSDPTWVKVKGCDSVTQLLALHAKDPWSYPGKAKSSPAWNPLLVNVDKTDQDGPRVWFCIK